MLLIIYNSDLGAVVVVIVLYLDFTSYAISAYHH